MNNEDTVVVPAWLGPNKLFVWARGKAYTFGLFALTKDRVIFTTSSGDVPVDEPRASTTFEWPAILGGHICRLRTPSKGWTVAFGRPFPDAPGPDPATIDEAVIALEALHATVGELSDLADLGFGVASDVVQFARSVSDWKKGLEAARVVKAALDHGMVDDPGQSGDGEVEHIAGGS